MKPMLLNLWVWIVAHPPESLAALSALLYLALNVVNARVPVEKRQSSVWYAILDALAIATQKGSESRASWPVVGRSIAKDVAAAVVPKPEGPPPSEPGFAERGVLAIIGGVAMLALGVLLLTGCSPTLPADLYRGVGTGVAVTASGGREVALLEARDCLARESRTEAEACLLPWRARWAPIAQAWQGAASRAQSLAHVVSSVNAALERRWPAMDAGAAVVVDAGGAE